MLKIIDWFLLILYFFVVIKPKIAIYIKYDAETSIKLLFTDAEIIMLEIIRIQSANITIKRLGKNFMY